MSVVGIDPSLAATGIVTQSGHYLVTSKPQGQDVKSRCVRYVSMASRVLQHIPTDTSLIVIEGYSHGSASRATHAIHEYGGILRERLTSQRSARIIEIPPATLKIFFTDHGNATKDVMARHARDRYLLSDHITKNDNLVDAFALYRVGMLTHNGIDSAIDELERQGFMHVTDPSRRKRAAKKRKAKDAKKKK